MTCRPSSLTGTRHPTRARVTTAPLKQKGDHALLFDKTPRQRAREQLATQKERDRLKSKEEAEEPYVPEQSPRWRRIDEQGVADQQAELDRLSLTVWGSSFTKVAFDFIRELGLQIRRTEDLNGTLRLHRGRQEADGDL